MEIQSEYDTVKAYCVKTLGEAFPEMSRDERDVFAGLHMAFGASIALRHGVTPAEISTLLEAFDHTLMYLVKNTEDRVRGT